MSDDNIRLDLIPSGTYITIPYIMRNEQRIKFLEKKKDRLVHKINKINIKINKLINGS
jgi:hypothetical protein